MSRSLRPKGIARLARGEELRNEERYFLPNTIEVDFSRTPMLQPARLRHKAGLQSPRPRCPIPALPVSWSQAMMANSPAPAWRSMDADRRKACWPEPVSQKLEAQTASAPADSKNGPAQPPDLSCPYRMRREPPMPRVRCIAPA
jgi:hypothetical protein